MSGKKTSLGKKEVGQINLIPAGSTTSAFQLNHSLIFCKKWGLIWHLLWWHIQYLHNMLIPSKRYVAPTLIPWTTDSMQVICKKNNNFNVLEKTALIVIHCLMQIRTKCQNDDATIKDERLKKFLELVLNGVFSTSRQDLSGRGTNEISILACHGMADTLNPIHNELQTLPPQSSWIRQGHHTTLWLFVCPNIISLQGCPNKQCALSRPVQQYIYIQMMQHWVWNKIFIQELHPLIGALLFTLSSN